MQGIHVRPSSTPGWFLRCAGGPRMWVFMVKERNSGESFSGGSRAHFDHGLDVRGLSTALPGEILCPGRFSKSRETSVASLGWRNQGVEVELVMHCGRFPRSRRGRISPRWRLRFLRRETESASA
jgi:hypothetical protein